MRNDTHGYVFTLRETFSDCGAFPGLRPLTLGPEGISQEEDSLPDWQPMGITPLSFLLTSWHETDLSVMKDYLRGRNRARLEMKAGAS